MDEFWREAALVARLRAHVNIVQFLGVCFSPLCVVTEFLAGGNLRDYVTNIDNKVDDTLRLKWFNGISKGELNVLNVLNVCVRVSVCV
jgi:serine/threonine protein kinase